MVSVGKVNKTVNFTTCTKKPHTLSAGYMASEKKQPVTFKKKKNLLREGEANERSRSGSIQHHGPALREDPVHVLVHYLYWSQCNRQILVQTELDPHRWRSTKQQLSTVTSRAKRRGEQRQTGTIHMPLLAQLARQASSQDPYPYSEHITPALYHPH